MLWRQIAWGVFWGVVFIENVGGLVGLEKKGSRWGLEADESADSVVTTGEMSGVGRIAL